MQQEPILILTTGGTIDKEYFDGLNAYQVGQSLVRRLLKIACVEHPTCIVELLRKDSLDMTDSDRAVIKSFIDGTEAKRVVITHGTDTMTDTAGVLSATVNKTIVLTGSFVPARFAESDAAFNLGMAIAAAQLQPAGIYIAMNGCVFKADQTRKDRARGRFVSNFSWL